MHLQTAADMSCDALPQVKAVTKASAMKRLNVACTKGRVMVDRAASFDSSVRRGDSMKLSRAR